MFRVHFTGVSGRIALLDVCRALATLVALGAFGLAVIELQSLVAHTDHSDRVLVQSNRVEKSVVDLETGVRGYLLTRQREFLGPTRAAGSELPAQLSRLTDLVNGDPAQERRVVAIAAAITAYRNSWVEPTLSAAGPVNLRANTAAGKRKVDALRGRFDVFVAAENALRADRAAEVRRFELLMLALVAAAVLLLFGVTFFASGWIRRRVVVPLLDLQRVLDRFGSGSLGARVNATGFAEVGSVESSFNAMADDLARVTSALEIQARTDGLTGLPNRRYFDEELERACANAQRSDVPLSLLILDIDRFKTVNDTFGHVAGDKVLKTVAAIYAANIRGGDLIARIGGDEFAILLPNTPSGGANTVADQIRNGLAGYRDHGGVQLDISIGAATARADADPDRLVHDADLEMYANKQSKESVVG